MKVVIVHIEEAKRGLMWYIISDNGHQVRSCPSWILVHTNQHLHRKHITLCPYTCRFFIYNYGEQCRLFSNLCAVSVYAISVEWSVCTSNPTHKKLISASLF
jgi:hypothetical protein